MFSDLNVAHLTGSAKVVKNNYFSDELKSRPRRTVSQMFFTPYESKEEFIFCARHTVQPLILIGLTVLGPLVMLDTLCAFVGVVLGLALAGTIFQSLGSPSFGTFYLCLADELASILCQQVIDLVLLPLTAIAFITRSVSTGLQAAGIYDYSASQEPLAEVGSDHDNSVGQQYV